MSGLTQEASEADLRRWLSKLSNENDQQVDTIDRMTAALKPLADLPVPDSAAAGAEFTLHWGTFARLTLRVGDVRRARAALPPTPTEVPA